MLKIYKILKIFATHWASIARKGWRVRRYTVYSIQLICSLYELWDVTKCSPSKGCRETRHHSGKMGEQRSPIPQAEKMTSRNATPSRMVRNVPPPATSERWWWYEIYPHRRGCNQTRNPLPQVIDYQYSVILPVPWRGWRPKIGLHKGDCSVPWRAVRMVKREVPQPCGLQGLSEYR